MNSNMLNSVINGARTSNSISYSYTWKGQPHKWKYKKNGLCSNFSSIRGCRGGRTSFGSGRGNGGRNGKICTHRGITGHTVEECYKKHGYPLWHQLHKPSQGANINNSVVENETSDNQNSDNQSSGSGMMIIAQQY